MGALDEILKQFQSWIKPIINNIQALHVVVNSGFDTKIRQEASGFSNIWSDLGAIGSGVDTIADINRSGFLWLDIGIGRLQNINRSGFITKIRQETSGFGNLWSGGTLLRTINRSGLQGVWARLDTKIVQERSGFGNTWSGLREVRDDIIQLQDINRSGFASISVSVSGIFNIQLSGLEDINRSGFQGIWTRLDTKITQEASGFGNIWSGLREVETTLNTIEVVNRSGFNNIQSGVVMLRQGEAVIIADGANISGGWSTSALGCYDRWTLYLSTSGVIDVTLELSPDAGTHYFEPSESPVAFGGAGASVLEIGYDATNIRITGNNIVGVTAIVRGCW